MPVLVPTRARDRSELRPQPPDHRLADPAERFRLVEDVPGAADGHPCGPEDLATSSRVMAAISRSRRPTTSRQGQRTSSRRGARSIRPPLVTLARPDIGRAGCGPGEPARTLEQVHPQDMSSVASLFDRSDAGDSIASGQLFAALYEELHQLAERLLRREGGQQTLGTTTLLHETYLALADREAGSFPDRARFLGYAAKAMRSLIIDYARARRAQKRGGEFEITRIGTRDPAAPVEDNAQLERVAEGLTRLSAVDPRLAELVDLHFFCGYTLVEIAAMRGVTDRTVQRDWRKTRMLLEGLLD